MSFNARIGRQSAPGGTPFASLTPAPPTVSCVVCDHLSPAGPVPLPVSEGGHVRQRLLPAGLCFLATNSRQTVAGGGLGQSIGGAKGGMTGLFELTFSFFVLNEPK